jgi:multisubunit Na+/H+ antiporter MnhB subunit
MALKPSEDETILRVTGALLVMAVVALAGLALVGSLDAGVGLPEAANSAASYGVLLVAFVVAGIRARRN